MADLNDLLRDLVISNHILAREGVTDSLGHVSVRHPDRPDRFFLSCSRSPELVTFDDIMEYDLECNPVDQRGRPMYFERPIHGAMLWECVLKSSSRSRNSRRLGRAKLRNTETGLVFSSLFLLAPSK